MPVTQLADVVVPEIFTAYVQNQTKELSAFVQSGVLIENPFLNDFLDGGGITVSVPNMNDLDNDEANVSNDDPAENSVPRKIGTSTEVAVRLSRNNSWSSMDLVAALAGTDPMMAIASRVSNYWVRQQQRAVLSVLTGVIADNAANDAGDYIRDITGLAGNLSLFSAAAFLDTMQTLGDASEDLSAVACHSVIYRRMQLLNLIDFIPNARGEITIPTFLGRRVVVDDALVTSDGATPPVLTYNTYLFGAGALQGGFGMAKVPTETERKPSAGKGGGQEILHSRVEWCIHPTGSAYGGAAVQGGPDNALMRAAASWDRVYAERKQVPIAVLQSLG